MEPSGRSVCATKWLFHAVNHSEVNWILRTAQEFSSGGVFPCRTTPTQRTASQIVMARILRSSRGLACVDVPSVEFEFSLPAYVVAPVNLCPARYSRLDVVPFLLRRRVASHVVDNEGARTDETHIPFQYIPKLG